MLTNLLAILVVILLVFPCSGPAFGSDPDRLTKTAHQRLASGDGGDQKDGRKNGETASGSGSTENSSESASKTPTGSTPGSEKHQQSQESPDTRVLTARLKGSLCVSCLFHLERKIQELEGVKSAHIVRPAKAFNQEGDEPNGNAPTYAQIQIIYLSSKLNPKSIRHYIHKNDFEIRDEKDVALTDEFKPLPDPHPLADLQKNSGGVVNAQMKQSD